MGIAVTYTEAAFQRQVIGLAKLHRWRCAHFRPAKNSRGKWMTPVMADGAGFPDLVLCRGNRVIFTELKNDSGRLSEAQKAWAEVLRGVGGNVEYYVWKPWMWASIEEVLR